MTRIAIIGLGLIGGSLGLALKASRAWHVIGYSRRAETGQQAREKGAIDELSATPGEAVREADLAILATPIAALPQVMAQIAPHLPPGVVVSDTASVKGPVMAWAQTYLPPGIPFIGGHPMAGKETWGLEAAQADLFQGAPYCLVPPSDTPPPALELVMGMAQAAGATPVTLSAEEHDHLVAGISHLPLVLAAALVSLTSQDPAWPQLGRLAAGGYRDTTRLASGNPQMSQDICLANRTALTAWLDRLVAELGRWRQLAQEDAANLEAAFAQARRAREAWLGEKGQKSR